MEEATNKQSESIGATSTEEALQERAEEATSSETLSDLAATQKSAATTGGAGTSDADGATAMPAPDGVGDEARSERADGSDVGGPM
ncbi:MAG: hypothetical protein H0T45_07435 [Pyrinomonadaceae bacterium]|nr:hypothetical protein [Pyrinomonadaceae bacterium]